MEGRIADQLQMAADVIAENVPTLLSELRAKTEAMQNLEGELAEIRAEVPRLKDEAAELRRKLRAAVLERDFLRIKLTSAEKSNLEQKRALENLRKVEVPEMPPCSTSNISSKTSQQKTDARYAELQDSQSFKSHPSTTEPMDLDDTSRIPKQTSGKAYPDNQITSGAVEPSALTLPLPSQSTPKPRPKARTKSTPKRSQSKASANVAGKVESVNDSGAAAASSSAIVHGPQCLCGKPYNSVLSLRQHIDYVSGRFSKICDICGEKFGSASNLKAHKKNHHPDTMRGVDTGVPPTILSEPMRIGDERFAVGCPECSATFNDDEKLAAHLTEVHMQEEEK